MLTQEKLKDILWYEKDTGEFIWKVDYSNVSRFDTAGYVDDKGYRKIEINHKPYFAHRLAWLYEYGEFPNGVVDHIDRNPSNNAISNLRIATRSQNAFNRPASKNNKLKRKNIYERKGKFMVQLRVNYKLMHFGTFEDLELAELVAIEAREKYHGEYARHA